MLDLLNIIYDKLKFLQHFGVGHPFHIFLEIVQIQPKKAPQNDWTLVTPSVAENIFWMQSQMSKVKLDAGAQITKF